MKLRILALGVLAGAGLIAQAQAHDGDHDRVEHGWQQREGWRRDYRDYDERWRREAVRPGDYGYYYGAPVVVERPRYYAPPVYVPPLTYPAYPYGYYPYGSGLRLSLNVPLR